MHLSSIWTKRNRSIQWVPTNKSNTRNKLKSNDHLEFGKSDEILISSKRGFFFFVYTYHLQEVIHKLFFSFPVDQFIYIKHKSNRQTNIHTQSQIYTNPWWKPKTSQQMKTEWIQSLFFRNKYKTRFNLNTICDKKDSIFHGDYLHTFEIKLKGVPNIANQFRN